MEDIGKQMEHLKLCGVANSKAAFFDDLKIREALLCRRHDEVVQVWRLEVDLQTSRGGNIYGSFNREGNTERDERYYIFRKGVCL